MQHAAASLPSMTVMLCLVLGALDKAVADILQLGGGLLLVEAVCQPTYDIQCSHRPTPLGQGAGLYLCAPQRGGHLIVCGIRQLAAEHEGQHRPRVLHTTFSACLWWPACGVGDGWQGWDVLFIALCQTATADVPETRQTRRRSLR